MSAVLLKRRTSFRRICMTTLLQVGLEIEKVLDVAAYIDITRCCNS